MVDFQLGCSTVTTLSLRGFFFPHGIWSRLKTTQRLKNAQRNWKPLTVVVIIKQPNVNHLWVTLGDDDPDEDPENGPDDGSGADTLCGVYVIVTAR